MTIRAIFVTNQNAEWKDSTGSSKGVSNDADFEYLKASRRWCDLIISSGPTVANNKYSPTAKPLWIISGRDSSEFSSLVAGGARVINEPASKALKLAAQSFSNVLCEFGPSSINEAIKANLLDELDLSITGSFTVDMLEGILTRLPFNLQIQSAIQQHSAKELMVFRFNLRPERRGSTLD